MSRRLSQTTSPAPPPPMQQAKLKSTQNGSCILPGYNAPVPEQNRPVRNKMKSNIFGVDENTKFEANRSNIGSGGDLQNTPSDQGYRTTPISDDDVNVDKCQAALFLLSVFALHLESPILLPLK
ncbi:hypothetical protein Ciccas_003699 [Cichlidogyrus casuarinus]|uniref:Uncharacterized protein n=1 Tax=Cichlidogyrus casuarinus TaxID=1844966 RepID=A0ABD2QDL0_9PLAT